EIGGTVSEIGITYLKLATPDGMVSVPNSQVLNAVVGPLPPGTRLPPPPPPQPAVAPAPPGTISPPVAAPESMTVAEPAAAPASSAGPVSTADGTGGAERPGSAGEQ